YLGVLQYEAGRFGEALQRFGTLGQQFPGSPLLTEAELRAGFCQVQVKDFPAAVKTLGPLVDKDPRLSDQALLWIGKAQAGMGMAADPAKPEIQKQLLGEAIATLRKGADRSQQLSATDPEAKTRRGEILLELADTHQLANQY